MFWRRWLLNDEMMETEKNSLGVTCLTGLLGCRWNRQQEFLSKWTKCNILWYLVLAAAWTFTTFWLYFSIIGENSRDNINYYWYLNIGNQDIFFIVFVLVCILFSYITLLVILTLCHVSVGREVYIHWIHRGLVVLSLLICSLLLIVINAVWSAGFPLLQTSLHMTGPFLHVSLVVVLTILTWFIASQFLLIRQRVLLGVAITVYACIVIVIYIFPAFINCPCMIKREELPPKPRLSAHSGGAALAPENTEIAFQYAASNYSSYILESDIIISYDGVPFMIHDETLKRTTNVQDVFPDRADLHSCMFNSSDIMKLNAGTWFLKDDPFNTVGSINQFNRNLFSNQKVLLYSDFLRVAKQTDTFIMFDIKNGDCGIDHPFVNRTMDIIVNVTEESGFDKSKFLWLYWESYFNERTTDFKKVITRMPDDIDFIKNNNITHMNAEYGTLSNSDIKILHDHNVTVIMYVADSPWLFSLFWCMGVDAVTTNQLETLNNMNSPVWIMKAVRILKASSSMRTQSVAAAFYHTGYSDKSMSRQQFLAIWIVCDITSLIICVSFWIIQRKRLVSDDSFETLHATTSSSLSSSVPLCNTEAKNYNTNASDP